MQLFANSTIEAQDFQALYQSLKPMCECIAQLMKYSACKVGQTYACHSALQQFFRSCAKQIFPALHFLPKCIWKEVEQLLEAGRLQVSIMESIAVNSPTLAGFFAYMHTITSPEQKSNVYTHLTIVFYRLGSLSSNRQTNQRAYNVSTNTTYRIHSPI
jgi:hypothetical protein